MNIMILAAIGIIFYMFTRKKEGSQEPSEPAVQQINLGTGTVRTAVIVKGAVKVSEPLSAAGMVGVGTGKVGYSKVCPGGYTWSSALKKCRKKSGWTTK